MATGEPLGMLFRAGLGVLSFGVSHFFSLRTQFIKSTLTLLKNDFHTPKHTPFKCAV